MNNFIKNKTVRIFLVALILRLIFVLLFGDISNPLLWEYGQIAKNIVNGHGFSMSYPMHQGASAVILPSAYMPPAYVFILSAFIFVVGERAITYLLLLFLNCISGAFSAVLIYKISLKYFPLNVAVTSGYLTAFYPPFIYACIDFGPTTIYMMLLGGMWFFGSVTVEKFSVRQIFFCGLTGVGLSLMRAEGILIVLSFCLWLFFIRYYRRAFLFMIIVILGISPWIIRNYTTFGTFVPISTSFGLNLWRGNNLNATGTGRDLYGEGIWSSEYINQKINEVSFDNKYEINKSKIFFKEAIAFITEHPEKELVLIIKKIFYFWTIDFTHPLARSFLYVLSWLVIFSSFAFGLFQAFKHNYDISLFVFYYIVSTLVISLFFVLPRYQITLTYGLVPISALGIYSLYKYFYLKIIQIINK
ncbi:MAG: hypothetical protein C0412_01520 [Flavobacterium sp.]|nr:hypothetical protein [Flavobacterium sp.]